MRIVATLVIFSAVLSNFIGISSGMPPKTMDLLANFGRSSKDTHNRGDSSAGTSSSARQPPSARSLPGSRHHFQIRSSSPVEPPLRERSRSPPSPTVLGYGLNQLEYIRLIPYKNPQRQFELRRYTIPAEKRVLLLVGQNQYEPVPSREQIVLSTPDRIAFAILDKTNSVAGIYAYNNRNKSRGRAKINMISGKVSILTADEIKETPVGARRLFSYSYRVEHLNHSPRSFSPVEPSFGSSSNSLSRRMALPTRLPSSDGAGYELDQLQYIRLISKKNPNQIFELRRYTFPADKLLFFLEGGNDYRRIPMRELIVITTPAREVLAILEGIDDLAGIYAYNPIIYNKGRIKMNMMSGVVTPLTKNEIWEVPVGKHRPISLKFEIKHLIHNPIRQWSN